MMDSIYIISHIPVSASWKDVKKITAERRLRVDPLNHCNVKIIHHVSFQRIQDFLAVFVMFFQNNMRYLVASKKKNPYSCED